MTMDVVLETPLTPLAGKIAFVTGSGRGWVVCDPSPAQVWCS